MALMAEDIDRLSELSDEILCHHILTKLPLKEAVASSLLSTKWRWLWTRLPRLNFSSEFCASLRNKTKINSIMKKLILINPGELESFELHITDHFAQPDNRGYHAYAQSDTKVLVFFRKMSACISYAALRNVKQLTLITYNRRIRSMPSSVFSCHRLTSLILNNLDTKCNPTHFGGFPCLKVCSFRSIDLCDAILEHLLAGSPHLESLTVSGCVGLINLTICCPFLNDLSIEIGRKENDMFHSTDLAYVPNIVRLNCPQLLNLKLERIPSWEDKLMLLKKMAVEINLPACRGLSTNLVCVKEVLDSFPTLEYLSMDAHCFLNCPLLETVTLSPPSHQTKISLDLIFVDKLLGLQRSSAKARIFITQLK
ncbi:F-box/LRR-repeat protein At5g02910 isoform X2 [Cryptomeria japonica]|uniref:F-box/LRR-repeat protein At5g02910 isoform X2 n=1 Tax=Cryptomeria japonica TaxID=3369 RepID=UPI0025ABDBAE|nr:F-box/LRR-repeat protein At5g02910 isoform X2 [Cryptomeria japonica]